VLSLRPSGPQTRHGRAPLPQCCSNARRRCGVCVVPNYVDQETPDDRDRS
jgi:hypothetical protein